MLISIMNSIIICYQRIISAFPSIKKIPKIAKSTDAHSSLQIAFLVILVATLVNKIKASNNSKRNISRSIKKAKRKMAIRNRKGHMAPWQTIKS